MPTVRHAFVSPKIDGPDPTIVRPSNWNEDHVLSGSGWIVPGMVIDYLGHSIPAGFLEAYGQSVSATTYAALYAAMVKSATVTFTAGTPGVVNWPSHGLPSNSKVRFRNSGGALPAAITANTDYYILAAGYTANSFRISATVGGAEIAFATGGTGTHTGVSAQFGVATDLTTFTVPDLRGYVLAGLDSMGGSASGRLTGLSGGVSGSVLGAVGGSQSHVLAGGEVGAHTHPLDPPNPTVSFAGFTVIVNSGGGHTPAGTIGNESAHTHTVDPPVTATTMGGAGSSHTHTVDPPSTITTAESADHTHALPTGRSGASVESNPGLQFQGGFTNETGTSASASGTGGRSNSHTHIVNIAPFQTGAGGGGADHTHNVDIAAFASGAGSAHTHTFTGTPVTAHTHTTTLGGTITSAQADFTSGANAGGAAHNNVQPTLIARKLIYAG